MLLILEDVFIKRFAPLSTIYTKEPTLHLFHKSSFFISFLQKIKDNFTVPQIQHSNITLTL